jgi:hypothetical protein
MADEAKHRLTPGMRIEAHWGSRWYPAEVLEVEGSGKVRVHYITGSKKSEPLNRLRLRPPPGSDDPIPVLADTKLVVGQELQAHWGSKWYDATILELEADGNVRIRYSTGTIESIPRLRLRLPPDASGGETPAAN